MSINAQPTTDTLWIDPSGGGFFLVPHETSLAAGPLVVVDLRGTEWAVLRDAIAPFALSASEASDRYVAVQAVVALEAETLLQTLMLGESEHGWETLPTDEAAIEAMADRMAAVVRDEPAKIDATFAALERIASGIDALAGAAGTGDVGASADAEKVRASLSVVREMVADVKAAVNQQRKSPKPLGFDWERWLLRLDQLDLGQDVADETREQRGERLRDEVGAELDAIRAGRAPVDFGFDFSRKS
ncbi:MAG: hypothetical protein ACI9MR_001168 [Myxococcota bacterium]|jgi:hypothetical protein